MSDTHDKIAAFCRAPRDMEAICAHAQCTRALVYSLVTRGMLQNVGNKRHGLYIAIEGKVVEPERTWREQPQIVQAASVWQYAQRMWASA